MSSIYDDTSCQCVQGIECFLDPRNYTPSYGVFERIDDHPIDFQQFYKMTSSLSSSNSDTTDVTITTKQTLSLVVQGIDLVNKGYTRLKTFQLNSCYLSVESIDTAWLEASGVSAIFSHEKLSKSLIVPLYFDETTGKAETLIPNEVLIPGTLSISMCTVDNVGEIFSLVTNSIDYTVYSSDIKPIEWGKITNFDLYYHFISAVNILLTDFCKVEEKVEDLSAIENLNEKVKTLEAELSMYKQIGCHPFGPRILEKIQDYLYEAYYDSIDYDNAIKFINERYSPTATACSSCVANGIYGRNYDWNYDNTVSFLIHTPNREGRYKVMGIAGSIPALTKDIVEARTWNDFYKYLPMLLVDGINEKGLCMNVNVTPDMAYGNTTGTNATATQKLCATMLVRYVLDHCATITEAVNTIKDKLNIFCQHTDKLNYEMHYMLSDGTNTKIIEFINNKVVVLDADNTTYTSILTNFHIYGTIFNHTTRNIDYTTVSTYGDGVERFNLLAQGLDLVATPTSMLTHMAQVYYTKAYTNTSNIWYTEYLGEDRTVKQAFENPSIFTEEVIKGREEYATRSRTGVATTWQTVHTAVYDIQNKKLYLIPQEGTESTTPIIKEL